LYISLDFSLSI